MLLKHNFSGETIRIALGRLIDWWAANFHKLDSFPQVRLENFQLLFDHPEYKKLEPEKIRQQLVSLLANAAGECHFEILEFVCKYSDENKTVQLQPEDVGIALIRCCSANALDKKMQLRCLENLLQSPQTAKISPSSVKEVLKAASTWQPTLLSLLDRYLHEIPSEQKGKP